jgi:2-dehydropantoate 2-reductase
VGVTCHHRRVRYVIVGAGAVGALLGARLFDAGRDSVLVARGANFDVLAHDGLRLESPAGTMRIHVPVVNSIETAAPRRGDVVIVAVKGQDSLAVLRQLAGVAEQGVGVICAQNGVENERVALRLFDDVYAMCVITPATHLEPGVVAVHAGPEPGVFDLGRWPEGVDDRAVTVAADLTDAGCFSAARADIATLKWGKLLSNIMNALEALVGQIERASELARRAHEEATAALAAAGVDAAHCEAEIAARFSLLHHQRVEGTRRAGGSSWQSLARGAHDIEADFLNGEITLLGRLHGVATPVNDLLQRRARAAAAGGLGPGSTTEAELLAQLS